MSKKKKSTKKKSSARFEDDKSITILLPKRLYDERTDLMNKYPGTVESIVSIIFGEDSQFGISAINWAQQQEEDLPDDTEFGPYKC